MNFEHRALPAVGKTVLRLGLAVNYGIDEAGVEAALDRGINYLYYTTFRSSALQRPLQSALQRRREEIVVAATTTVGFFGGSVRRAAERALKALGTDYLDVFQLGWLGVAAAWSDATQRELLHLKESGKVKAIGASIHDRPRAGKLAEDSPLDRFMLRYNAAHPGAEREVFPRLEKRRPLVVAYTATSWRKLLAPPRGWQGATMTAGDCYRFCLSSPHVDVVLTGPASRAQLDENLAALARGPLSEDESTWMRAYGKAVHG